MFEHIGTDLDVEAGRRRRQSTLLTMALAAGLGGAIGVWASILGTPDEVPVPEVVSIVQFAQKEPVHDEPPPTLPAAPRARGGRSEPQVPPDVPAPLSEPPKPAPVVDSAPVKGTGDDDTEGEGNGKDGLSSCPGGRCGPGGTGDGPGGGGVRVFHHSELQVKRRVDPRYPSAARDLDLGDQRCIARVTIEADGRPSAVEVEGCPSVFHGATREALLGWRWYPPEDAKVRVRAATTIAVSYRMP